MATAELVTFGETMALLDAPTAGPLRHAAHLTLSIGGAESNVAIAARRLGAETMWFGRVGDDEFGARVLREIRGEGVRLGAVIDDAASTGLMVKERTGPGRVRVRYYRAGSAGSRLQPADVDAAAVANARILHVTGITPALSASARNTVHTAVAAARRAGTVVSVDLNYRQALWAPRDFAATMRDIVASSDIVFGSADEVDHLIGRRLAGSEERVEALADFGPGQCVVKLGAQGCVAGVDGDVFAHPAFTVPVVDTVGAGDAFVAGWLATLLRTPADVPAILRNANACGAFACTVPGDWESAPSLTDLIEFVAQRDESVTR
jgi:2-dehydro-3-deoxygluconokinase